MPENVFSLKYPSTLRLQLAPAATFANCRRLTGKQTWLAGGGEITIELCIFKCNFDTSGQNMQVGCYFNVD
jgi:hypothetical protein